ncbi:MAG: Rieske 2Fe-2S domain-containing protein, partial [Micromonosporaceae bacterium]
MTQTANQRSAPVGGPGPEPAVRTIDVGAPPTRYARGWHCLGLSDTFRDGKPHAVEAFGTKLVVFADSHGALHVLDAYCRHMGGDLTQGTVKGDQVACPFHDWRWGGDGKCKAIPYAKRIPLRARTRSWTTCEENKQLFVWNDPQGNPPPPEQAIPRIDGVFSDEWSDWTWDSVTIEGANCREIIDNVVDMAHFFYIHYAFPTYFKNVFEGHIASQYLDTRGRPDINTGSNYNGETEVRSEASYFGPSYMIDNLWNTYQGVEIETILINCHYPVTPDSFVLQWGVIVKKLPGLTDEHANKLAAKFAKGVGVGFLQDVEIWRNKTRIDNPLLCEEDGPVYQLRRWYEQFYV